MNLQQFKSWKLLYEDQDLCFSKAVYEIDKINVFFISFFKPENLSIATKHMIEEHLNNYLALIEDDGKLHLVLREQTGHPIKKFISKTSLSYDDRLQIAYSYLKHIVKYDVFPDAIKIQLLDDEQCLINDDGLSFRELVDYTLSVKYSHKDVLKQVGITLDMLLHDSKGYHSQFIDNLIIGNHPLETLSALKNSFKDIFIFEKPEALETISSEYTIILNDLDAGPPLKFKSAVNHNKTEASPVVKKDTSVHHDDLFHEDLQRELADLLITPEKADPMVEPTVEPIVETIVEPITEPIVEPFVEPIIEPITEPVVQPIAEPISQNEKSHTKSFKAIFEEEDQMPESLPKSGKQRYLDEDTELFDDDMSQIFDEDDALHHDKRRIPKWLILLIAAIIIAILSYIGFSQLFNVEPVSAQFVIEPLRDDRIAFMNTSTGDKMIDGYSWEIYYAETLVQTFTDKNLFPVFDTEGEYKIVLKVKDKEGNWSEPYFELYEYSMKEE